MARFSDKYYKYLHTEAWRNKKKQVIERSRKKIPEYLICSAKFGVCEKCGFIAYRPYQLELHHLTYERLGNESLEDLILLCRRCHQQEHELLRMIKEAGEDKKTE